MIQVGDRVRICNLQAPFAYGALATVEIVEDRSTDGLAYICFDRLERITTSSNPNDRTRRWWIEKEFIEVVDFNEPASDESPTVEETTHMVVYDEIVPAEPQLIANENVATEVFRRLEASMTSAAYEMSQQLRQRRASTPSVWPDPGYGDPVPAADSQETQTQADSPVARSYGGTLL